MISIPSPMRLASAGALALSILTGTAAPTMAAQSTRAGHAAQPAVAPSGVVGRLGPLLNIAQTWNNCGPASVAEVLNYWGINRTQGEVQAVLRADGNPHGMSPYGAPAYARSLGVRALLGIAGSERMLKALISNGFPVIVSQWISQSDHYGHYRPIQAYDDHAQVFTSSDPYLGQGHQIGYAEFATLWASTNNRFMVIYPPSRGALLSRVLASVGWNSTPAFTADLKREQGLMNGTVRDATGYGSPKGYYLAMAWDELQLGHISAARSDVQRALAAGANPMVAGWVSHEIAVQRGA